MRIEHWLFSVKLFFQRNIKSSWTDTGKTIAILLAASLLCFLLKPIGQGDSYVPLIFVLAVLFISRMTSGYLYGLIASIVAVFGVNFVFTYPYYAFNFTMTGYPITFICMFAVSAITCTLTTAVKQSDQIRLEGERDKMRANLLRAISHDLRTPLTSIVGSSNLILDDKNLSVAEKEDLVAGIREEAEWLNNMVDNILSITRFEDQVLQQLNKEPEVVEEVVEEAVNKFRRQMPADHIEINVDMPEEILIIPMDAILIEQVLVNLLWNAVNHGEFVRTIQITTEKSAAGIAIHVADDGKGILPELIPVIFDEQRAYAALSASGDTSRYMGIGLSVCKTIIEAHQGTISVSNRQNGGAEFTFTLPFEEGK